MAETVLTQQSKAPEKAHKALAGRVLQRACACGQHNHAGGECEGCKKKRADLQRFPPSRQGREARNEGRSVPPIVHHVLRSSGRPLDEGTRQDMENRFGHDFSQVRVHTDEKAARSAQAVEAQAYTVGRNIVFGERQYSPATAGGQRLLAHELTHTLQQTGVSSQPSLTIGRVDDPYEREAEQVSARVVNGQSAQPAGTSSAHLQRRLNDGHDLSATRFAGNRVLEAVYDDERLLQHGSRGTAVRLVQESLIAQGYDLHEFGADGIFGDETEAAVRAFQVDAGAEKLDGIIGPETMQLLDMRDPGGSTPTGPGATPPPAGAPAPPPATGVAFSEHPDETFAGYDSSIAPDWLVVPVNERRRARAAPNPAGSRPAFVSGNPAIATVDVAPDGIVVTGVSHGETDIQAQEAGVTLARLRVSVKNQLRRSVAFHYVCDSPPAPLLPHCSNGSPSADTMRSLLNRVWERQSNVLFTGGRSANVVAAGNLGAAVDWTSPGGGEWNVVTALGVGADYNVFRVWRYMQDGVWPNDAANLGNNTLIGDNPCADGLGLAHECGHFLGLDHPDGFIMTPCGGRANRRVSKAMADKVNP
jgi:peptidoglycan hydrolase-like protein with peptidoglycan-binding domain